MNSWKLRSYLITDGISPDEISNAISLICVIFIHFSHGIVTTDGTMWMRSQRKVVNSGITFPKATQKKIENKKEIYPPRR